MSLYHEFSAFNRRQISTQFTFDISWWFLDGSMILRNDNVWRSLASSLLEQFWKTLAWFWTLCVSYFKIIGWEIGNLKSRLPPKANPQSRIAKKVKTTPLLGKFNADHTLNTRYLHESLNEILRGFMRRILNEPSFQEAWSCQCGEA